MGQRGDRRGTLALPSSPQGSFVQPSMARRNIFAALLLLSVSTWYGVLTASLPERAMPNTPGPAFFPWLITGGLVLLSAALLVRGLVAVRKGAGETPEAKTAYRTPLALIWFVAYLIALPTAGFVIASVPFFAGLMILYGERCKLLVVLAAIAVPVVMFYLFRYGFQILLPSGVWW